MEYSFWSRCPEELLSRPGWHRLSTSCFSHINFLESLSVELSLYVLLLTQKPIHLYMSFHFLGILDPSHFSISSGVFKLIANRHFSIQWVIKLSYFSHFFFHRHMFSTTLSILGFNRSA